MILVVGATGTLGMEICRRLVSAGQRFSAMVRSTSDPVKKEALDQLGGQLAQGDLKDRSSLDRACAGATAVITTPTAILSQQQGDTFESVDLRGQMQLVDAAVAAKVGHFVFISVSGNLLKHGDNPLCAAKAGGRKSSPAKRTHLHDSAPDIFHGNLVEPASRLRLCKCQGNNLRLRRKQDQLHLLA